jgi:hypothetical protein
MIGQNHDRVDREGTPLPRSLEACPEQIDSINQQG